MSYTFKIFINDEELKIKYEEAALKHNETINNRFFNAGFDLFCPCELSLACNKIEVNTQVTGAMYDSQDYPCAYYLYPRSSISKTDLQLANSVGIIDNSYRGPLIGKFNNLAPKDGIIEKYSRLLQVCSPTLGSIRVVIMNSLDELEITDRGDSGFGSTGK
jgi:dUTP pyrophosphatase